MHDQVLSFQGLSSVNVLLITVSKSLETNDEKRLWNFRKCQLWKMRTFYKKWVIVSSSLKDGLFKNIIWNSYYTRRLTSLCLTRFSLQHKNTVPLSLQPWMFWTSDSHQQPSYWIYLYEKRHFFFKNAKIQDLR